MAADETPTYLYKYRKFTNRSSFFKYNESKQITGFDDYGLDALAQGCVWFSHLDYLNDPFENQVDYSCDSLYHNLSDYLCTMPPDIPDNVKSDLIRMKLNGASDEQIIARIENSLPKEDRLDKDIPRRQKEINLIKKKTGILSLCKSNDNLLMWAHYADEHYGYCLEFSSKEQHKNYKNGISFNRFIAPVVYSSKYYTLADVNPFYWFVSEEYDVTKELELKKRIFCHKSEEWKYEEELRIFLDITDFKNGDNQKGALLPFPGKLTTVYCGARMSDEAINALKLTVAIGQYGYMPKFKKARLKKNEFGLEFDDC